MGFRQISDANFPKLHLEMLAHTASCLVWSRRRPEFGAGSVKDALQILDADAWHDLHDHRFQHTKLRR